MLVPSGGDGIEWNNCDIGLSTQREPTRMVQDYRPIPQHM